MLHNQCIKIIQLELAVCVPVFTVYMFCILVSCMRVRSLCCLLSENQEEGSCLIFRAVSSFLDVKVVMATQNGEDKEKLSILMTFNFYSSSDRHKISCTLYTFFFIVQSVKNAVVFKEVKLQKCHQLCVPVVTRFMRSKTSKIQIPL